MTSVSLRAPKYTEKQIIKTRRVDRETAILKYLSDDKFESRYKVHLVQLEDGEWHAECRAHSFLTRGFDSKECARLLGELHVRYFHFFR